MSADRIEPSDVVVMVDGYVEDQLGDIAKYSNREAFDESGCFTLHRLAAAIYARGYEEGERAESARSRGQRLRDRDRESKKAEKEASQRPTARPGTQVDELGTEQMDGTVWEDREANQMRWHGEKLGWAFRRDPAAAWWPVTESSALTERGPYTAVVA